MGWDDGDWDDWVRGQPGTFWGEEKQRLSQPYTPPPQPGGGQSREGHIHLNVDAAAHPPKPVRSAEDWVKGIFLTGVSGGAAYLAYTLAAAPWVLFATFLVTAIGGIKILETAVGQKFVRLLTRLVGWGLLALIVFVLFHAFSSGPE